MEPCTTAEPFRILTVCTGNVCRSPLAEAHLLDTLRRMEGVTVSSAGTRAVAGDLPPAPALAQAVALGLDLSEHRARLLTLDDVRDADLILGLAGEHRRAGVDLQPRASRRTFTLREFARLAVSLVDSDFDDLAARPLDDRRGRLTAAVDLVSSRRHLAVATTTTHGVDDTDDVVAPLGHADTVYSRASEQIVPADEVVVRLLAHAATVVSR